MAETISPKQLIRFFEKATLALGQNETKAMARNIGGFNERKDLLETQIRCKFDEIYSKIWKDLGIHDDEIAIQAVNGASDLCHDDSPLEKDAKMELRVWVNRFVEAEEQVIFSSLLGKHEFELLMRKRQKIEELRAQVENEFNLIQSDPEQFQEYTTQLQQDAMKLRQKVREMPPAVRSEYLDNLSEAEQKVSIKMALLQQLIVSSQTSLARESSLRLNVPSFCPVVPASSSTTKRFQFNGLKQL